MISPLRRCPVPSYLGQPNNDNPERWGVPVVEPYECQFCGRTHETWIQAYVPAPGHDRICLPALFTKHLPAPEGTKLRPPTHGEEVMIAVRDGFRFGIAWSPPAAPPAKSAVVAEVNSRAVASPTILDVRYTLKESGEVLAHTVAVPDGFALPMGNGAIFHKGAAIWVTGDERPRVAVRDTNDKVWIVDERARVLKIAIPIGNNRALYTAQDAHDKLMGGAVLAGAGYAAYDMRVGNQYIALALAEGRRILEAKIMQIVAATGRTRADVEAALADLASRSAFGYEQSAYYAADRPNTLDDHWPEVVAHADVEAAVSDAATNLVDGTPADADDREPVYRAMGVAKRGRERSERAGRAGRSRRE